MMKEPPKRFDRARLGREVRIVRSNLLRSGSEHYVRALPIGAVALYKVIASRVVAV